MGTMAVMAVTGTRSPHRDTVFGETPARARDGLGARARAEATPGAPAALGVALAVAVLYAMFASGAIGIPEESRLQIGVGAVAFGALAALLFGRGLHVTPTPLALAGVALLAGFAAWSGLSIAWSIAPDESWLELNRGIAYALVAGLGLALGSSLPRAAERVALGYLAIATLVAAHALGGKLFPWLEIPGLLDLNHTARLSRLRAPLEYWNALGLVCVLAVPVAVRAAAELGYRARARIAAHVALVVVLVTLLLTYSRGGLLALVVALAGLVVIGPAGSRLLATAGVGVLGALPAVLVTVLSEDLRTNGLSVSARTGEGLLLALALAAGIAIAIVLGNALARRGESTGLSEAGRHRARLAGIGLAVAVPLIALIGLGLSERGVAGSVSHQFDEFTRAKFDRQNDPARVLQTNSGNRWIWWEEAAGAFSDRPLVGHGAGSFPLLHRLYRDNSIEVRQPHNVPLEFLSETGLIGATLGLGGLALLGIAGARTTLARAPGRERGFAAALLVGAGAWGVHTLVDWDWDIPGVTLPVLIFLGVLAARPAGSPGAGPGPLGAGPGRGPVLALGAAGAVVIVALAALPALAKELTSDALSQASTNTAGDLTEGAEKAALAKRLNPFDVEPVLAQAAIAERGNQPAAAAGLLVEAVERQPDNPATWFRLARFQIYVDDTRAALRSVVRALELDPAAVAGAPLLLAANYDERRSASATGTPLPERLPGEPAALPLTPAPPESPRRPRRPGAGSPRPPTPPTLPPIPPLTPAPPTPPAPQPAPRQPAPPREPPAPPPSGDPFRLEG